MPLHLEMPHGNSIALHYNHLALRYKDHHWSHTEPSKTRTETMLKGPRIEAVSQMHRTMIHNQDNQSGTRIQPKKIRNTKGGGHYMEKVALFVTSISILKDVSNIRKPNFFKNKTIISSDMIFLKQQLSY